MIPQKIIELCEQLLSQRFIAKKNTYIDNFWDYLNLSQKIEFLKLPKGTILYSPAYGEVTFERLNKTEPQIEVKSGNLCISFYSDGKLSPSGECLLFPSKATKDFDKSLIEGIYKLNEDDKSIIDFSAKYHRGCEIKTFDKDLLISSLEMFILRCKLMSRATYIDYFFSAFNKTITKMEDPFFVVYVPRTRNNHWEDSVTQSQHSAGRIKFHYSFSSEGAAEKFIELNETDLISYFRWKYSL